MGYYTDYTLTASICTVGADSYTTATIPHIALVSLEDEIEKMNIFDGGGDIEYGYYANAKWYDWEEDMCLLSKRFPELLFCLHGEGESSDDLWDAYFFEGKCQHCPAVITYEDFDPSKLCAGRESADTQKGVYSCQSP